MGGVPRRAGVRIDFSSLLVQWVVVAALVGVAMMIPWRGSQASN
jgi:hypothetical protein